MSEGFTSSERAILKAVAEVAIPAGELLPGAGPESCERLERFLASASPWAPRLFKGLLWSIELGSLRRFRRRFTRLDRDQQLAYLEHLQRSGFTSRTRLRVLLAPLKIAHFTDEAIFAAIGCEFEPPAVEEQAPRWWSQVHDAGQLDGDTEIDAEVVVVGTGAGGAVVAKELAELGHAVLMVEEGAYFTRQDFTDNRITQTEKMYRDLGLQTTLGNAPILLPTGKTVGGSTTINSGTCFRIPDWVLREWREDLGLRDFSEAHLEPYYQRVEATIGVAPAAAEQIGVTGRLIARGADALGLSHHPLLRNAPECEGKGLCCFGCPTDAKRSTNVSYVPLALRAGAQLFTGARVERVTTEAGHATGVEARSVDGRRRLRVRAPVVVVAAGTLFTPQLLRGIVSSPVLGHNLTVHPASAALALFDERIAAWDGIPQGYCIDGLQRQGITFEGAFTPLDYATLSIPLVGPRFVELMESFANVLMFGFMIHDSSRGRVLPGPLGRPPIIYHLNRRDVRALQRALITLCEVYFAAGARRVYPMVHGFDVLRAPGEIGRLRRAKLRGSDFDLMAFHPLGTARLGVDPRRSVVDVQQEAHDLRNLFVVDGSVVPTPLSVNPQIAIMTLATRAAEIIDRRLARIA